MSDQAVTGYMVKAGEVQPSGRRFVLWVLCHAADDVTWRCAIDYEYFARVTGMEETTLRRHLAALEADEQGGPWIGRERLRNGDGTLGHYAYELSLEKLSVDPIQQANCRVARESAGPVENHTPTTRQNAEPTRHFADPTRQNAEPTRQIAGSLKEDILPSFPSSFIFEDEDEKALISRVIAVCGLGLADWAKHKRVLESLRRVLPNWIRAYDFELDVLPVIKVQTHRPRKKPVYDFALFEPDLRAHRLARLPGPAAATRAAPAIDDEQLLSRLQQDEHRVSIGMAPLFSRAEGETLDDARLRIGREIEAVRDRIDAAKKQAREALRA